MTSILRTAGICLLLIVAGGCAGGANFAPVADRYNPPERAPSHYVVSRGDTLYSIAWRYGMDFRQLAAANNIDPPYRIYPDQKLVLEEAPVRPTAAQQPASPPAAKPSSPVSSNTSSEPKSGAPAASNRSSAPVSPPAAGLARTGWQWPVQGEVVKPFKATGHEHKGIDIEGKLGEPVRAAAAGTVVYAGSGLVGYGNLLIVKHDERYLSAYAHNSRLLVKEGESVKSGQHIADMGNTGTDSTKLHFQIRRDGKPIDPLQLLPKS